MISIISVSWSLDKGTAGVFVCRECGLGRSVHRYDLFFRLFEVPVFGVIQLILGKRKEGRVTINIRIGGKHTVLEKCWSSLFEGEAFRKKGKAQFFSTG